MGGRACWKICIETDQFPRTGMGGGSGCKVVGRQTGFSVLVWQVGQVGKLAVRKTIQLITVGEVDMAGKLVERQNNFSRFV